MTKAGCHVVSSGPSAPWASEGEQPEPPAHPGGGRPGRLHRRLGREQQVDGERPRPRPLARHRRPGRGAGRGVSPGGLRRELAGGDRRGARGAEYFPRPTDPGDGPGPGDPKRPRRGSYAMYTTYLLAVSSARRSISITNPYFLLDDQMIKTLRRRPGGGCGSCSWSRESSTTPSCGTPGAGSSGAPGGRHRDPRVPAGSPPRQDDGHRRDLGHRGQHQPGLPLVPLNDELNVVVYDAGFAAGAGADPSATTSSSPRS